MDKVFKALADPTRRRILQLLRQGDLTAGELAEHFTLAKPTLSGHFAVLREADLVSTTRAGTTLTYQLNLSVLEQALLGFAQAAGLGLARPAKAPTKATIQGRTKAAARGGDV